MYFRTDIRKLRHKTNIFEIVRNTYSSFYNPIAINNSYTSSLKISEKYTLDNSKPNS